ncbi:MAG: Crp/Fnr family transcriptional regulator [Hydrogenophaga sp.]|uniref:Crp/Fnr family transcriptional regulator n=1 Tax=Hydrogenophaga sp. TaxID=1904254 RepID=UPI0027471F89|nr:Crp/Fnr family transcriptional regulator [Hydrogenophaga sp.]MDP2417876.1 Crp/Fnr family transcriptional regulator [Hydrogenophaga sp.]MDZ4187746.1 Crp/Fnr family transcriptional regulator [Hydrogenophaga sp.]
MPTSESLLPTWRAALASDEWFAACSNELQDVLLRLGLLRQLEHGQSLFSRGDSADGLCCVMAGGLYIGAISADGQHAELAYLEPYQWFGEIGLIDGLPRTHNAVADGETRVLVVPRRPLLDWLDAHPEHWRELARLVCQKLRVTFVVLEELALLPLEERIQRRLCLLAQGYGSRGAPRRRIRLGQEVLARMLGVSRQSVNKALKTLESRGFLRLHYGEIELLE